VTPERWSEIKQQLEVALSLTITERRTFLQSIGAKDDELRRELESLLVGETDDPDFMNTRASSLLEGPWLESGLVPNSMLGRNLGAYRVTAQLGVGGMGEVYLAVRADRQYDQQVAVKIVRPGLGGEFSSIRFRIERQILARLDHPNIAKILDGGTTEDGLPYFVMEFIDGLPITEYCDRNRLSIEERFRLFRAVCSAVHYAHQHLVVHRDIKPSNILVTPEGIPKLLDFGIAKMLSLDSPVENATMTGFWAMTPEYASPEQLRGEPITTATDVYSLGLILYELLTGQPAHRFSSHMPHEMARIVLESEPAKPSGAVFRKVRPDNLPEKPDSGANSGPIPSTACDVRGFSSARKLYRRLAGDADNIVLKALREETSGRYASADQLSEDIRRHLEGRPITASKGTTAYRFRKYVVRHKVGVASGALIFLTLVTGVGVTLREERIAQRNELRAERRFNDVRQLANSLLFDIHDAVKDLPGSTPARKLIVQNALEYLDSLSSEAGDDRSLQRELATAYERVGGVQGLFLLSNLGETENALHSFEKALRLRKTLASSPGSSWQDKLAVARCSRLVATQLQATGKVHDALENIRTAIPLAESLRKEHPQEVGILEELSQDYGINAYLHRGGGVFPGLIDWAEQSESRRKAIAVDEAWLKLAPFSEEAQHALAWDQVNYAETLGPEKKDEALGYFLHSLAIEKQIRAHTNSPEQAREIVSVYNRLGMFYDRIGDTANAVKSHRNALKIAEEIAIKDPHNQHFVLSLAVDHANIADGLLEMRQIRESKLEIAKAIEVMEGLARDSPENVSYQITLSEMHSIRAKILRRSNDPAASLHDYKIALDVYRNLLDKDTSNEGPHLGVAICSMGIAKAELQLHRPDEASASFRAALESLKLPISSNRLDQHLLYIAADAYAGLGRIEAAKAGQSATTEARSHWEAARGWFRMSLEQLTHISQAMPNNDVDVGPIDIVQVKKELSPCEAALRNSKSNADGRR
jgi:eukaryotic-like serine/threonine-protein kinase